MENDFHEWKKRNHENRGVFMEKKGSKMQVSFEWRKGKNDDLKQFLLMKSEKFLSIKWKQK